MDTSRPIRQGLIGVKQLSGRDGYAFLHYWAPVALDAARMRVCALHSCRSADVTFREQSQMPLRGGGVRVAYQVTRRMPEAAGGKSMPAPTRRLPGGRRVPR